MTTMRAMSCAHPAAVIKTSRETARPRRETARARRRGPTPGTRRGRRSTRCPHRLALAVLVLGRLACAEVDGLIAAEDAFAPAHQSDGCAEEHDDQKHHPHVSHRSPRIRSWGLCGCGQ